MALCNSWHWLLMAGETIDRSIRPCVHTSTSLQAGWLAGRQAGDISSSELAKVSSYSNSILFILIRTCSNTWARGRYEMTLSVWSGATTLMDLATPPIAVQKFLCVNMAPLGFPVVPLVKQTIASSSGRGGRTWRILFWQWLQIEFGSMINRS